MKFYRNCDVSNGINQSRPARGVWIEIFVPTENTIFSSSRPARGVWIEMARLKLWNGRSISRPARGVWIEIICEINGCFGHIGRAPRGACGLKYHSAVGLPLLSSRAPRGACGLKLSSTESSKLSTLIAPHSRTRNLDHRWVQFSLGMRQIFLLQKKMIKCKWEGDKQDIFRGQMIARLVRT